MEAAAAEEEMGEAEENEVLQSGTTIPNLMRPKDIFSRWDFILLCALCTDTNAVCNTPICCWILCNGLASEMFREKACIAFKTDGI